MHENPDLCDIERWEHLYSLAADARLSGKFGRSYLLDEAAWDMAYCRFISKSQQIKAGIKRSESSDLVAEVHLTFLNL